MKQTYIFKKTPGILASAAVASGKMEEGGPLSEYFDKINIDPYMSADTFEKGESKLQKQAILHMLEKAKLKESDIDVLFGGDLLKARVRLTEYGNSEYRF